MTETLTYARDMGVGGAPFRYTTVYNGSADFTSAYRRWWNRLHYADIWERGIIRQWCNAVVKRAEGNTWGGQSTNLAQHEAEWLVDLFEERVLVPGREIRLEPSHEAFGREWIHENIRAMRNVVAVPADFDPARMIEDGGTFRFVGWETRYNRWGWVGAVVPAYRVRYLDLDGEEATFTYAWSPWQG